MSELTHLDTMQWQPLVTFDAAPTAHQFPPKAVLTSYNPILSTLALHTVRPA